MKNIYVIPTDKPSRLFEILQFNFVFDNQNMYSEEYKKLHSYKNKNIYIINDEEIKEGDWYWLEKIGKRGSESGAYKSAGLKASKLNTLASNCKKIILTTDQDLIKDGVQAIDDEFLEWFVKNPSCESVEIDKMHLCIQTGLPCGMQCLSKETCNENINYKIIIPKEEQSYICPKTNQNCDDEMCDSASNCNISSEIKENKEPSFEEISNQFHQIANDFKHPFEEYEMKSCKTYSDNQEKMPKQETLEEDLAKTDNEKLLYQIAYNRGVLYGIKWQQEQDKKLYSEEDLQTAFSLGRTYEYSNHESTNQLEIVQYLDNLKKQKKSMNNQKFKDRISDIIDGKIDGEKGVKEQIIFASKKMAIAFWEVAHEWEPQLGDTKARNIFNGEQKEIDEILGEFLSKYKLN